MDTDLSLEEEEEEEDYEKEEEEEEEGLVRRGSKAHWVDSRKPHRFPFWVRPCLIIPRKNTWVTLI